MEELGGEGPIPAEKLKAAIALINEKLAAKAAKHEELKKNSSPWSKKICPDWRSTNDTWRS